jgi:integral membrane protein
MTDRASIGQTTERTPAEAAIDRLRLAGKVEAVSFLVLLGIAMPLKYLAGLPLAVKIVGWVHGLLFIGFVVSLWRAKARASLSTGQALSVFIAALLPFGPFIIDHRLAREARAHRR